MWVRVECAAAPAAGDSPSRAFCRSGSGEATSGPAQTIEQRSSEIGHLRFRRERLAELGNRARMLRQRKRASLIDQTLRQITMEILRHETSS